MGLLAQMLAILWCLLVWGHNAAGSLHFDVIPPTISPGLTDSLAANCTFSFGTLPDVAAILSLIISKAEQKNDQPQTFKELVSLMAFASNQVSATSQLNAVANGHVGTHEDSFLSLRWTDPDGDQSGLYRCDVNVLDKTGRPKVISTTAHVTSSQPGLEQVIEKLNMLQTLLENQEHRQSEQEQLMKSQNNTIVSLQSQLDYQWKAMSMFETSVDYNGHYYLLSKPDFINISASEIICEDYGGYLTEIDDAEEHNFIKDFVNQFSDVNYVVLGATDEATEGQWKFRYSGKSLVYTDWYTNEPTTDYNWNCMDIYRGNQWKMFGWPCTYHGFNEKFLCEVPFK